MSRDDVLRALERAIETVRLSRAIARQVSVREVRDTLLLEAVALESVTQRVERLLGDGTGSQDLSELTEDIERLMVAMDRAASLPSRLLD